MGRYLVFELSEDEARRSDFADYALGSTLLLPRYFGELAPVNIFLGENNSGKSRLMREIMKRDPMRVIDLYILKEIESKALSAHKILDSVSLNNIHQIDIDFSGRVPANSKILALLFEKDNNSYSNNSVNAGESINILRSLIFLVESIIKSPALFLKNLQDEEITRIVVQMKSNILLITKVANIYEGQNDGSFDETSYTVLRDRIRYKLEGLGVYFRTLANDQYYSARPGFLGEPSTHAPNVLRSIIEVCQPIEKVLTKVSEQQVEARSRTYVPVLRTARTINLPGVSADFIEDTIVKDYSLQNYGVKINSGLRLYSAVDDKKNSDFEDRKEFREFEVFLEETFFSGKPVEIVYKRKDNSILVRVDQEERALPYLGDGIQAIILLLYPLFIAKKGAWFFIEEPETHLHPGFQRIFIKTIVTHPLLLEKQLTIFLTTHSNHMLDFAIDEAKSINLFTFNKTVGEGGKTNYQVQLTAPHDLACLTALGVQNSSVFLSNCTIWVEGITDRIYLKAYLKAYLAHKKHTYSLLEGLHYSFLEYAGANVSHYTFGAKSQPVTITDDALKDIQALSISNRIMLIADQDAGKQTKHERLTSQQHAGFEYIVLPTREIENLLMPEVIVRALRKLYSKQTFDASSLKPEKYQEVYLGSYLRTRFPELKETFVATSGTIDSSKKRKFAEAAAEAITSWEQLSPEAQKLAKQVFDFIIGHNPRLGSN